MDSTFTEVVSFKGKKTPPSTGVPALVTMTEFPDGLSLGVASRDRTSTSRIWFCIHATATLVNVSCKNLFIERSYDTNTNIFLKPYSNDQVIMGYG